MPPATSRDDRDRPANPKPTSGHALRWPRLLMVVALLNAPMFFQGCESQKLQFTLGLAVPFARIEAADQLPRMPASLVSWSWPKFAANIAVLALIVWFAARLGWLSRVFASTWFAAILAVGALLFGLWLVWPDAWEHLVWAPQNYICAALLQLVSGNEAQREAGVWWVLFFSGRLYYLLLIVGLSLGFVGVRFFLRRYFFVRSGSRWQIQLGGLVVVMLILGAGLGMAIRLLMP